MKIDEAFLCLSFKISSSPTSLNIICSIFNHRLIRAGFSKIFPFDHIWPAGFFRTSARVHSTLDNMKIILHSLFNVFGKKTLADCALSSLIWKCFRAITEQDCLLKGVVTLLLCIS